MTTSADTTDVPPAAPPPLDPRPRLERSTDDRYIGGVCGGLGRYFDIDPVIFRVAIACLATFGAGLVLYAVAWAFVPASGQDESVAQATRRGASPRRELLLIGLVVIAGFAVLGGDVGGFSRGDSDWIVPLLFVGGFLWWRHERGQRYARLHPHHQPNWPQHSPPAWQFPPATAAGAAAPDAPPTPSAFWAATATAPTSWTAQPAAAWAHTPIAPRPPRERSHLGTLTFSVLLIAAGIAAVLDGMATVDLNFQGILASALVIVGGGLVVGAWYGRSRGLIVLGVLLTLATSLLSTIDVPLQGESGDLRWQVTTVEQLDDGYHLRAGAAVLDLTALEIAGAAQNVEVTVGFGELTILLPEGVPTHVTGHVGAGDIRVLGERHDGFDIDIDAADKGTPLLTIDVRMGLGDLEVRHQAP